jgi:hypothetical protein
MSTARAETLVRILEAILLASLQDVEAFVAGIEGMTPSVRAAALTRSEELLVLLDDLIREGPEGNMAKVIQERATEFLSSNAYGLAGVRDVARSSFDLKRPVQEAEVPLAAYEEA